MRFITMLVLLAGCPVPPPQEPVAAEAGTESVTPAALPSTETPSAEAKSAEQVAPETENLE